MQKWDGSTPPRWKMVAFGYGTKRMDGDGPKQGVYPYLFRWRDSAGFILQGRINGRILYYNYSTQSYE